MRNVQTLALDRMLAVSKDDEGIFRENTFFDPNEYLDSMVGVTRGLNSTVSSVLLKIDGDQAPYVLTKPLHVSQRLHKSLDDGSIIVSLNVILNFELERLILGYGSHIEVLAPRLLRRNIATQILTAATIYQNSK